jgi:CBS domain containing-hemolysin-like protein
MWSLGRVPLAGDVVTVLGHRLDVVTMDGRRVERLRVTAQPEALQVQGGETGQPGEPPTA